MSRTVVVGGGISGLSAAWFLTEQGIPASSVTVIDEGATPGGKLAAREVGGVRLDVGAEAMLATRPEAVALAESVGLQDRLENPTSTASRLFVRGQLRQLPGGLMMGAPTDLHALAAARILGPVALARVPLDLVLPRTPLLDDVSVGDFVGRRLGRGVVDYLVDPLLGGVYSGRADDLSLEATVPMLFKQAQRQRSLLVAARSTMPPAPKGGPSRPVFAGIQNGVTGLAEALVARLLERGVTIMQSTKVGGLSHEGDGWSLQFWGGRDRITADAVVLATPATVSAHLLAEVAPNAAAELTRIEYGSVAVVNLAYRASDVAPLDGSGYLAPPVEGGTVKAATFLGRKWGWIDRAAVQHDITLLRASVGRHRDAAVLDNDDARIVDLVHADLSRAIPISGRPVDTVVTRWIDALPQYAVGHIARVQRIRAAVAEVHGLAVCGAAFDGVGIAACIASAAAAAGRIAGSSMATGE